jgi:autophagy-related protein 11
MLLLDQDAGEIASQLKSTIVAHEERIQSFQITIVDLERQLTTERIKHDEEFVRLNQQNRELAANRDIEATDLIEQRNKIISLKAKLREVELEKVSGRREREKDMKESQKVLEEMNQQLLRGEESLQHQISCTDDINRQLESSRATAQDLARQAQDVESKYSHLCSDNSKIQWDLSRARNDLSELEDRLQSTESTRLNLTSTLVEKERYIRSQREESDLDRALLEKELNDARTIASKREEELHLSKSTILSLEETIAQLRDQLAQQSEVQQEQTSKLSELESTQEVEKRERDKSSRDQKRELDRTTIIARSALIIASELREERIALLTALSAGPSSSKSEAPTPSEPSPSLPPPEFTLESLDELLASVKVYERNALGEAVKSKIESLKILTKKWQKECKSYRERAHRAAAALAAASTTLTTSPSVSEKIAFRK